MNNVSNNPTAATNVASANRESLSEASKRKLEDIKKQCEESKPKSKFLKITDGEQVCLLFNPDKIERVEITYPVKDKDGKEIGRSKPTKRIKFQLKQADVNGVVQPNAEEIEWTASETTGEDVIDLVLKGFYLLDIERKGSGKNDTEYKVTPHV